ncbi:MAG: hypothetical protein M3Y84_03075 [Acidobacteriota bacterium]|nr:hypothetical protein [Acidobacteriota bacterium]
MVSKVWAASFGSPRLLAPGKLRAPAIACVALFLVGRTSAYGQVCPDPPPQTSGTHRFHQQGESFDIPISLGDCQPIALELRWANGRNNGSNFLVTFLDSNNQPIFTKELSGFMTGNLQFPFATLEPQPWLGSASMISVPRTVTIRAVPPFAFGAISYTVTRAAGPPGPKARAMDEDVAMNLRAVPGRLLASGRSSIVSVDSLGRNATERGESITYSLEEVTLTEPRELEIHGRMGTLESAFRLMLAGGKSLPRLGLIWIDDAALPLFTPNASQEIGALIYDRAVLKALLKDGGEISVSNYDGSQMYSLVERLKLPENIKARIQAARENADQGNEVVSIHRAVRVIGATRQPLVQIEMKTNRPFPAKDTAVQLQMGKRFFLNELSGDPSGRSLTLTLTPEIFAELKQGSEIVAFFDKPDRSGFAAQNIWYFGRLNKDLAKLNSEQ